MNTRHTRAGTTLGQVTIVAEVPFGETTTYGAIAERLGGTSLSYRVGQHGVTELRVPRTAESLGAYIGRLEAKTTLLELDAAA
ncbi:MAG TPA: MGMT family protein [Microbacteriaceae bacterium]